MSSIPKINKKPKYNNNKAFEWVDSQWEKFMTEQKEHKSMIKQLQKDLATCTKNFQKLREDKNKELPIEEIDNWNEEGYIYESPDEGKTIYRRKIHEDYTEKIEVNSEGKIASKQLNLFDE